MPFFTPDKSTVSFGLLFMCLQVLLIPTLTAGEPVTVKSGKYQTAVIELYTSEGCNSCPPADQWFNKLVKLPKSELDVLALSFHVDYWDYIGWTDKFANPAYTYRQRHLARVNQQSSVYTPEFFVNGREARGTGSVIEKAQSINKELSTAELTLTFQQKNDKILLNLSSQFDPALKLLLRFVVFENNLSSDVKAGENAGLQLHHQQVVRYLSPKKTLKPDITHTITINPRWNINQLAIGAFVKTKSGDYVQAVSSTLNPTNLK